MGFGSNPLGTRPSWKVTRAFFDRDVVIAAVDKATRDVLSKFGAFVRTTAKQSIKKAPFASKKERGQDRIDFSRKTSTPGSPPYSQTGKLKKGIFFSFDRQTKSVVVGPARFPSGAGTAPATLEYGGAAGRRRNMRRTVRHVGDGGEVEIGGWFCATTKINREGTQVTYIKLRTQAQADRANRLNEKLYGPMILGPAAIAARPYMHPALQKELPKLPAMWANSVKP